MLIVLLAACAHVLEPQPSAPVSEPPPVAVAPGPVRVEPSLLVGTVLFPDELRQVDLAVASVLEDRGFAVLALEERDRLHRAAAEGRRPDESEACSVPYVADYLLDHRYPEHRTVSLRAFCEGDGVCSLELSWYAAPGEGGGFLQDWVAPLDGEPSIEGVVATIPSLALPEASMAPGGVMGGGGTRYEGQGVAVGEVTVAGPWDAAAAAAVLRAVDLDGCWSDARLDHWRNSPQIELGEDGSLLRCSSSHPQRVPEVPQACVCESLAGAGLPAGEPGRRAQFDVLPYEPTFTDGAGQRLGVSVRRPESELPGPAWVGSGMSPYAFEACLAPVERVKTAMLEVEVQLDARGVPQTWDLGWPDWMDDEVRACFEEQLATARYGCSQTGEAGTLQQAIGIHVR